MYPPSRNDTSPSITPPTSPTHEVGEEICSVQAPVYLSDPSDPHRVKATLEIVGSGIHETVQVDTQLLGRYGETVYTHEFYHGERVECHKRFTWV